MFSNREIATAFWIGLIAIFAIIKTPNKKQMLLSLVTQSFNRVLLVPFALLALYVGVTIAILQGSGLWTTILLKDTIIWFGLVAIPLAFTLATSKNKSGLFKNVLTQSVTTTIFVEFLISTYTFSLLGELILFPVLTFLAALVAVAATKQEYAFTHKGLKILQLVAGLIIVLFAAREAWADSANLWQFNTLLSFLLAPVLSLLLVPYIYLLSLYAGYQELFVRLRVGVKKDESVIRYAQRRLFSHLRLNRKAILGFLEEHRFDLTRARNQNDIDKMFEQKQTNLQPNKKT